MDHFDQFRNILIAVITKTDPRPISSQQKPFSRTNHGEGHEVLEGGEVSEEHVVLRTEAEARSGLLQVLADGVAGDEGIAARRREHP